MEFGDVVVMSATSRTMPPEINTNPLSDNVTRRVMALWKLLQTWPTARVTPQWHGPLRKKVQVSKTCTMKSYTFLVPTVLKSKSHFPQRESHFYREKQRIGKHKIMNQRCWIKKRTLADILQNNFVTYLDQVQCFIHLNETFRCCC